MADNEVWKLDLDTKEFVEKLAKVKDLMGEVGSDDNTSGLVSGLKVAATAMGVLGVAALALKTTLNLMEEAEHIKAVNTQFEFMTKNAGIATDTLRKGLKDASGGLIDDTDLLNSANKSIVQMGDNAKRLPELMEAARKVTALFGGDLTQNFDTMSDAISRGNTRMLKQYGIIVDNSKAIKEYAKSHNLAANELSEHAKQAALMEAVLEKADKNFKGINPDILKTTNSIKELKVMAQEFVETLTLHFQTMMNGPVGKGFEWLKEKFHEFNRYAKSEFGTGAEQVAASAERMGAKVEDLKKKIFALENEGEEQGFLSKMIFGSKKEDAAKLKQDLFIAEAELKGLNAQKKKMDDEANQKEAQKTGVVKAASAEEPSDQVDYEKKKQNYKKFQEELLKIKQDELNDEFKLVTSMEQADALLGTEKALRDNQYNLQKQTILQADYLNETMKKTELNELDKRHKEEQLVREQELAARRMQLMEQVYMNERMGITKVTSHFKLNMMQMEKGLQDYKKQSVNVFAIFDSSANTAMESFASGSASASQAAKGFFFGFLGDVATKHGALMLLQAIWPPNPIAAAGGTALLVLGRVLKSAAGSSGGGGGGGGGEVSVPALAAATPSATSGGTDYSSPMPAQAAQQAEVQKKTVTISIQGNYFETDQTRTKLMDMMREATDATDLKYVQVGSK